MKKSIFALVLLICLTGCTKNNDDNDIAGDINKAEVNDDINKFFDSITTEMLDTCDRAPTFDEYTNDSLVFLNELEGEDILLYGINVEGKEAILLLVDGEKWLIDCEYLNLYQELPEVKYKDIDNDNDKEIVICIRTVTGNISRYKLCICDYDNEKWKGYTYNESEYLAYIDIRLSYSYDENNNEIEFKDVDTVIYDSKLPDWCRQYEFRSVEYNNQVYFDIEDMSLIITPEIGFVNSLPLRCFQIKFDFSYNKGEFVLEDSEIIKGDLQ